MYKLQQKKGCSKTIFLNRVDYSPVFMPIIKKNLKKSIFFCTPNKREYPHVKKLFESKHLLILKNVL